MGIIFYVHLFDLCSLFQEQLACKTRTWCIYKKHTHIHAAEQKKFASGLILNYSTPDKMVWVSLLLSMHLEKKHELMHLTKHTSQPLKNINMELIITPVMYLEWISHFSYQSEL